MALHILKDMGFGERIGTGLGQGIGGLLSGLAQQKLQNMADQQAYERNYSTFVQGGFRPEIAAFLARNPQSLAHILERGGGEGIFAGPQQQASGLQVLGGMQELAQQQSPIDQAALATASPAQLQQAAKQVPQPQTSTVAQLLSQPTARERREEEKLDIAKKKLAQTEEHFKKKESAKEQAEIDKETLPEYKAIIKEAKAAKDNNKRLERMEELNEKGSLGVPLFNSVIVSASPYLDVSSLMSADAQEFNKLSNDFIKSAKEIFGSRITDNDLKAFLKTVPTLAQTQEGRRRVIRSLKSANEASLLKKNALDELLKENKGKRPRNLELLIEEKIAPQLDELAKSYVTGELGSENSSFLQALGRGTLYY